MSLGKGAVVPIHIADPQALLTPATGLIDFNLQVHVIASKGLHYNAPIQTSTAISRDHGATIPFGSAVTVRVISPRLTVNDQSGVPVKAAGTSVTVPAGAMAATVAYTVTGTKQQTTPTPPVVP